MLYIGSGYTFDTKLRFLAYSRRAATFLGLILLSGIFLPDSPYVLLNYLSNIFSSIRRHLIETDRREEARKVIAALNGVPEDDCLVNELASELDFAFKAENEGGKATWLECFSTRNYLWKRTINGMILQFFITLGSATNWCVKS